MDVVLIITRRGARGVEVGGRHLLSGGLLSFPMEAADDLLRSLRRAEGKRSPHTPLVIDDEKLRALPALISTAWLFDIVPRTMEPAAIPVLHNSNGEKVVLHCVRFSFAPGRHPRPDRRAA